MQYQYDPRKMNITHEAALGALLIIAGVVLKNSAEAMKQPDSVLGLAAFVGGWAIFANAVARNGANAATSSMLPYGAAAIVVGSVMLMKRAMKAGTSMQLYLLGFVVGWLLFAWSLQQNHMIAFASAGLVFASMLLFLPQQRKACVVDGPGWPLFVLAWIGLIIANSNLVTQPIGPPTLL